ncbi:MAG TPA: hypothetical protein EYP67_00345 [Methanosarcinales archaeon]|nr:hypothetical protein [Methanosarcinales archaeon]
MPNCETGSKDILETIAPISRFRNEPLPPVGHKRKPGAVDARNGGCCGIRQMRVHNPCHLAAVGVKGDELLKRTVSCIPEISHRIFDRKGGLEIREIKPDVVVTNLSELRTSVQARACEKGLECDIRNIVELVERYQGR